MKLQSFRGVMLAVILLIQTHFLAYAIHAAWMQPIIPFFEPDNTPAEAKVIGNGEVQNRSIHLPGDEDWVRFAIGINGATNLRIETDGTTGDTLMWLYGPNSSTVRIAIDDDSGNGYFSLINRPVLGAGTYYIRVTDYGNNSRIAAYTLKASWVEPLAKSNLTPVSRAGWSDKIVVSKTTGSTSDSAGLLTTDTLYIDWAIKNIGNTATGARFATELYVDGLLRSTWFTDPPVTVNQEIWVLDYNLSQLSAGTHTLRIKTDAGGVIAESNETDNEYAKTITVTAPVLPPYEPDNIPAEAKAISNSELQTRSIHAVGDVDWIMFTVGAGGASNVRIETDGPAGDTLMWLYGPDSSTAQIAYDDDSGNGAFSLITRTALTAGSYYIKVQDLGNNGTIPVYSLKASWDAVVSKPNLTPFTRSGWSDKIVVSKTTGSTTDSTGFLTADTLYVDWAIKNIGNTTTGVRVYTALYVDGQLKDSWYVDPPLGVNQEYWILDFSLGPLAAGIHTIGIKTDSSGVIAETNEMDNEYAKTVTVTPPPFEPDNTPEEAKAIANGEVQHRSILPIGDIDWIRFTVGATGAENARIETDGVDGDTQMWLYGPNSWSAQLAFDDDSGNNAFSLITQSSLAAGTYFIKVLEFGSDVTIPAYTLKVSWDIPTLKPNLTPYARAGWSDKIVVSTTTGTTTDSSGLLTTDSLYLDWAIKNVGEAATGTRFYTEAYLDGVLKNSWYSDPPVGISQEIQVLDFGLGQLNAGTHTLLIKTDSSGLIAESNETDNEHTKIINVTAPPLLPYEPDNTPGDAKAISNGEMQNRSIHPIGDIDWIKFTIGPSGASAVRIETDGVAGDTEIWLYGPNNSAPQIAYDNDSGNGAFSLITRSSLSAGTYYVKVQDYGHDTTINAYTLRISWTGPVLPADLAVYDSNIDHLAGYLGDSFILKCRVKNQGLGVADTTKVYFYANPNSWSTSAVAMVGEADLGVLASSAVSPEVQFTWRPTAAGNYYVGFWIDGPQWVLESNEANNEGFWPNVTVTEAVNPAGDIYEPDETPEQAKEIHNGEVQNRSIHIAGTLDWIKFVVGANGASNLRIETDGPTGDTQMWLYGPNTANTQLTYDDDSGNGSFSMITQSSLATGTYYIKLGVYGNQTTLDQYTLRLTYQ